VVGSVAAVSSAFDLVRIPLTPRTRARACPCLPPCGGSWPAMTPSARTSVAAPDSRRGVSGRAGRGRRRRPVL